MTKAHTTSGPARYLPGTQIRSLETATVCGGQRTARSATSFEYVRQLDSVIGWDQGQDAYVSFAERSGGAVAGRSYHGRPMARSNPKLERR
jgi:hypothetical protein